MHTEFRSQQDDWRGTVDRPADAATTCVRIQLFRVNGVAEPKQVRYLWNWCKAGRLKNDYGFPLAPFYVRAL